MERTEQGGLTLTSAEGGLVRAALFLVKFHVSNSVKADAHIYTGYDHAAFVDLLDEVDRVWGLDSDEE